MAGSGRHVCCLGLLLGFLAAAEAYPFLYASRWATTCTSHPATSYMGGRGGGHLAPEADPSAKFQLSVGGRATAKLCPGTSHVIRVTTSTPRYGLLTATAGEFAEGDPWECPNRVLLDTERSTAHNATLNMPCQGVPASVVLQLTTAEGVDLHFKQASATVPVDPACAAVKCKTQQARLPAKSG